MKKNIIISISVFVCSLFLSCYNSTESPNIVLIISDDQGYSDLSCMKINDDVSTPNIDKLAASGIRFTQAYATSPICSASRAGIITGSYQERFGTYWYGGEGIHDSTFTTLAEVTKQKGYVNGYLGKVHYGSSGTYSPSNRNFPTNHGFDSFYGFCGGRKHYLIHNQEEQRKHVEATRDRIPMQWTLKKNAFWENEKLIDQEGLATNLLGERARKFIKENKNDKFFLTVAFNAIHNFTHQLPKEYLDKHSLGKIKDWDPSVEKYWDWYVKGRYPNNPEGRALYLGQLYYLDQEIGKIVDYLHELELDENTVVIYISDNGGSTPIYANNKPLRGAKYTLYEGGIRVPMIISYPPNFEKNKVVDNVVSAMDIYPTICNLIGAEIPDHIDGIDITTLLEGENKELSHETLFWDVSNQTAVRDGKWKYRTAIDSTVVTSEMVKLEVGEFLYDLEKDPGEQVNLIEKYPLIKDRLKTKYEKWKKSFLYL